MLSGDYETKMTINKKDFLESIERSVLLIRENDKKPIILNLQNQILEMNLTSMMGTMKEEILVHKQGKDIMIGFNPKFLIDALRVIEDETVDIYMVNSKAPCFIRDEQQNYIYLILPVNFNRA
jgi:DNA polymerase-3 subunit beta